VRAGGRGVLDLSLSLEFFELGQFFNFDTLTDRFMQRGQIKLGMDCWNEMMLLLLLQDDANGKGLWPHVPQATIT